MDFDKALRRQDPTAVILLARPGELSGLRAALGCGSAAPVEEIAGAYQTLAAQGDPLAAALKALGRRCDDTDGVQAALTLLHPGETGDAPLSPDACLALAGDAGASSALQAAVHAAHLRLTLYCRLTRQSAAELLKDIPVTNIKPSSWSLGGLVKDVTEWTRATAGRVKAGDVVRDALAKINLDTLLQTFNTETLETAAKQESAAMVKFNVLVAGKAGAGKSTLINAIFGESLAAAGMGRPVTQETTCYERPGVPFRLWDTKGLEMAAFERTLTAIAAHVDASRQSDDANDHLHVIWLCIEESNLRIEDGFNQLLALAEQNALPVIIVLTKSGSHPEFVDIVRQELPTARDVVRVRALETRFDGQVFPAKGLDDLINATRAVLPDGVAAAFDAAQQRQAQRKFDNAEALLKTYVGMAATAAAVPIPLAAAASIIPVQLKMVAALNGVLGIEFSAENWKPLTLAVLSSLGLTTIGRLAVVSLLEFIPGAGSLAGGAINATMAGAMTYGLGKGYIAFVKHFHEQEGRLPNAAEIVDGFKDFWSRYDAPSDAAPPPTTT